MTPWEIYKSRVSVRGNTRRDAALIREQRNINSKLVHSLSYQQAVVDGEQRDVAIVSTDNLDIKHIYSMPSEDIRHGAIVDWFDNHWLVIEKDYGNEVYTKAKMQQCNHLLKWIDEHNNIHEQWCIVSDGTKLPLQIVSA